MIERGSRFTGATLCGTASDRAQAMLDSDWVRPCHGHLPRAANYVVVMTTTTQIIIA